MTKKHVQSWVGSVRRLIVTGQTDYLDHAIKECEEPQLQNLLKQFSEGLWQEAAMSSRSLVAHYLGTDHKAESTAVFLLGLDYTIGHLPMCDPDFISGSNIGVDFSRRAGFSECEGKYLLALGICSLQNHEPGKAESFLAASVRCFSSAVEETPVYDLERANALVNLGAARQMQNKHKLAVQSFREAAALMEKHAKTEGRFRGILSAALGNLAIVLQEQGASDEALETYARSIRLMKSLIPEYPDMETHLAETLTNSGSLHFDLGRFADAVDMHKEAMDRFLRLREDDADNHGHQLAVALSNLSNAYQELRLFPKARQALEDALEIRREISSTTADYASFAAVLINIGSLQYEEKDWDAAKTSLEEAVAILREIDVAESREYLADLSSALNSLGMVHWSRKRFTKAQAALDEAVHIRRVLTGSSHAKRALAESLQNRSTVLRALGKLEPAAAELIEAKNLILETAPKVSDHTLTKLISVMNNLVVVYEDLGQEDLALEEARETIQLLETAEVQKDVLWLLKGKAGSAYGRIMLADITNGANDETLRCFATLRNPAAFLSKPSNDTDPEAIAAELRRLEERLGKPVKIFYSQALTEKSSVMAMIGVDGIEYAQSVDKFHAAAAELFRQMTTIFNPYDSRDPMERSETIHRRAEDAWALLPGALQSALSPESDHRILMSGDSTWTQFPWEGLRCSTDPQGWLGLQRTLPRLHGLSASSLSNLRHRHLPASDSAGAAVIAPWNVGEDSTYYLHHAWDEAEFVAERLFEVGFKLLPEGQPLIGAAAHATAVKEILARDYAILHFSGHGAIVRNEEMLVLPSRTDTSERRFLGRQQIIDSKTTDVAGVAALVVLNACSIGQTHSFGGRREDLVSAFLGGGAEAVIASALPVLDDVGQILGETLYDGRITDTTLGPRVVQTRRLIENKTRGSSSWPGWAFISCHGNPFARMSWLKTTSTS